MRRGIETVPKDGKLVILEDDASATYKLAQWSAQAGAWIGENGKPIKMIPTHWHAMRRDADVVQEQCGLSGPPTSQAPPIFPFSSGGPQWPSAAPDVIVSPSVAKPSPMDVVPIKSRDAQPAPRRKQSARRFALSSIAAAMIASSLIGMYFRAEVSAYVTQYAGEHDHLAIGTIGAQIIKRAIQFSIPDSYKADMLVRDAALPQQAETGGGNAQTATWEALQITKTMAPEATQLLENERRRADLAENELADFRRAMEGRNLELQAAAQSLERDRGQENATLVQALAAARQELTANEDKYRRALADERDRGAALASELATARRDIETQAALSSKTGDETAQLKQAAVTATAELQQARDRAKTLEGELVVARRDLETHAALSRKAGDEAHKQAAETVAAELQQERDRAKTLASELATARRDLEKQAALSRKTDDEAAQLKQLGETATAELQKERDRAETLASELAMARWEVETQATLARKATDEATQLKQAVQTTSEFQQSLKQEREKAKTLESELAMARREVETQAALSRTASEEIAQLKQATRTAIERQQKPGGTEVLVREPAMTRRQDVETQAALSDDTRKPQSLNYEVGTARAEMRERDRSVPTDGPKPTRRSVAAQPPLERPANSQTTKAGQAVAVASSEQPAAEANVNLEAARLVERANALLGQGNIGAARVVLERATEAGSAQATFRLAETYDPLVLSTWGTYGTRGDAMKARELYAKAYDGGIKAAKDRSDALQTAGSEAK